MITPIKASLDGAPCQASTSWKNKFVDKTWRTQGAPTMEAEQTLTSRAATCEPSRAPWLRRVVRRNCTPNQCCPSGHLLPRHPQKLMGATCYDSESNLTDDGTMRRQETTARGQPALTLTCPRLLILSHGVSLWLGVENFFYFSPPSGWCIHLYSTFLLRAELSSEVGLLSTRFRWE